MTSLRLQAPGLEHSQPSLGDKSAGLLAQVHGPAPLNPGVERLVDFVQGNLKRNGHDPQTSNQWVWDGLRQGGVAKLVEMGTPSTPNLVNEAAFRAAGLGPQTAQAAWQSYQNLRGEAAGREGLPAQMSSSQAWQAVFRTYLYGLHNGGNAGGLQAMGQLSRNAVPVEFQPTTRQPSERSLSGNDAPMKSLNQGTERLIRFANATLVRHGNPPETVNTWVWDGWRHGGVAKLVEMGMPKVPQEVSAAAFQAAGMGAQAAQAAWQSYQGLRGPTVRADGQASEMPIARAWQEVFQTYLYGLYNGGQSGGLQAMTNLQRDVLSPDFKPQTSPQEPPRRNPSTYELGGVRVIADTENRVGTVYAPDPQGVKRMATLGQMGSPDGGAGLLPARSGWTESPGKQQPGWPIQGTGAGGDQAGRAADAAG